MLEIDRVSPPIQNEYIGLYTTGGFKESADSIILFFMELDIAIQHSWFNRNDPSISLYV